MKWQDVLKNHKKKLLIAVITIGACFFPPVAKLLPVVEISMPGDSVSVQK